MRYAFIRAESAQWPVRALCDLFDVHPSGYYAWLNKPCSKRAIVNERLSGLIKQFWLESGGVYGYRKIFSDLREYGCVTLILGTAPEDLDVGGLEQPNASNVPANDVAPIGDLDGGMAIGNTDVGDEVVQNRVE